MDLEGHRCHAAGPRDAGASERACVADLRRGNADDFTKADDLGRPAGSQHYRVSGVGNDVAGHPRHRRDHHRRGGQSRTTSSGQCQGRGVAGDTHSCTLEGAGAADGLAGGTRKRPGDPDLGRSGEPEGGRLHCVLSLHRRRWGDLDRHSGQPHDSTRPFHPLHRPEPHQRAVLHPCHPGEERILGWNKRQVWHLPNGYQPRLCGGNRHPAGRSPGQAHGPVGRAGRCRGDAHVGRSARHQHHQVPGQAGRRELGPTSPAATPAPPAIRLRASPTAPPTRSRSAR